MYDFSLKSMNYKLNWVCLKQGALLILGHCVYSCIAAVVFYLCAYCCIRFSVCVYVLLRHNNK